MKLFDAYEEPEVGLAELVDALDKANRAGMKLATVQPPQAPATPPDPAQGDASRT